MSKRKDITYTAVIESLTRLNSSVNGNPRFMIHFKGGATARTQVDASIAYGLENPENIGVPVKVTATPSGLVWNVEPEPVPEQRVEIPEYSRVWKAGNRFGTVIHRYPFRGGEYVKIRMDSSEGLGPAGRNNTVSFPASDVRVIES